MGGGGGGDLKLREERRGALKTGSPDQMEAPETKEQFSTSSIWGV